MWLILVALLAQNAVAFKLTRPFNFAKTAGSSAIRLQAGKTMFDKIWDDHLVSEGEGNSLIYIDRHLVHEVTSPQAFEGLRVANRQVRRPDCTLTTVDHNVPTTSRKSYTNAATFIEEEASRLQVVTLEENVKDFKLPYFGLDDTRQGIVHIIGPEQGFTLPGTTIVCGDSHTSTHGAFGALAFGIGTSEVEHVLATQTLSQSKAKNMRITVNGKLDVGVTSKDVILHIIGVIGTAGGTGHVIEFAGEVIRSLSMEARMSICNMAIEAGARAGLIAPDETTFSYLENRVMAPKHEMFEAAKTYWRTLISDTDAKYDKEVILEGNQIAPSVTWGTSPQDVLPITGIVPNPLDASDLGRQVSMQRSLDYMSLTPGQSIEGLEVDKVFIGSCTNARIEDIRAAAVIAQDRHVSTRIKQAMVVPGSGLVKAQAEAEGLHTILLKAGFEWREPGCSMCLAMNPDRLEPGERCASTSNRNFEGRQGTGGRTHLVSPAMAAAAAIFGKFVDVRKLDLTPLPPIPQENKELVTLLQATNELNTVSNTGISCSDAIKTTNQIDSGVQSVASNVIKSENNLISDPKKVFNKHIGVIAKLEIQNIDTDMIIPKQFLKTIQRSGLGKYAFYHLRYSEDAADGTLKEREEFVLNQPSYRKASILVTGNNFGCGSSREHAPWSLSDFGIRAIISTSFADIFYNNCFKNGILPIVLPVDQVKEIMSIADAGHSVEIDLPSQIVKSVATGQNWGFQIDTFRKTCLLQGLDDIGVTMQHQLPSIERFESKRSALYPWLDNASCQHVPTK